MKYMVDGIKNKPEIIIEFDDYNNRTLETSEWTLKNPKVVYVRKGSEYMLNTYLKMTHSTTLEMIPKDIIKFIFTGKRL